MKTALIIGNTNVGKTTFMISFAQYLGLSHLLIKFEYPNGKILQKEVTVSNAIETLSSKTPHKTTGLQSLKVEIPVYKGKKELNIIDTTGLIDGIHPDIEIRRGIGLTLERLEDCHIILHMVDLSLYPIKETSMLTEIDKQLIDYGETRNGYMLLANKVDVAGAEKAIGFLKSTINTAPVIPISAIYKSGFNEVKKIVIHSI